MKLKYKLPVLFLTMFIFIFVVFLSYIRFVIINNNNEKKPLNNFFSNPGGWESITFLLILLGIVFLFMIIYIHFKITRPIQKLNERILNVNIHQSTDIKKIKAGRDEISELQNHFNNMEEKLYQARKEQIDMITAIAHDIKTPLTSINGFIELLLIQEVLSEDERREYYRLILKKSKHITELICDFSTFSKEELELYSVEINPISAKKLFESIAEEYEAELSGLDYEFTYKHTFNSNDSLNINENMIRRVFGNIFSNAVRYADKKNLKIFMNGYIEDNSVFFEVEDNGKGVPDRDLPSLFQIFYTVDKSRQSETGGMGLGLASCKSIIEHHGGEITAYKSRHGGLKIQFNVPLI